MGDGADDDGAGRVHVVGRRHQQERQRQTHVSARCRVHEVTAETIIITRVASGSQSALEYFFLKILI